MGQILGKDGAETDADGDDSQRLTGVVKWFSRLKGYGFIASDDGSEVFVHYSAIKGDGYRDLSEGDKVSYLVVDRGKGPQADDVKVLHRA
ncbi:MAG: cold shock domain-containing protein [Chloroflexi bacterium]|nr:cold shock domain-containing protein [Chloroflexota bacterium]